MINHEFICILRNPKWKYMLLILLFSLGCYAVMRQEFTQVMGSDIQVRNHGIMISTIPVFLSCFLLYHIASEEERQQTWKTLLAFPVAQGKRIFAKMIVLLLCQVPIMILGILCFFVLNQSFSIVLIQYIVSIQIIYLVCFMYYTFIVASGYIDQVGSVMIINVLKIFTPTFLASCIINSSDWIFAFQQLWWFLCVCAMIMMAILFKFHDELMRRKLYREMILYKVLGALASNSMRVMMDKLKNVVDHCLQSIFRLFARKSKRGWRAIAAIEVGIKLNSFYILIGIVCFIIWRKSMWFIFLPMSILCFFYVIYNCRKERKKIQGIRIMPKENI